MAERAVFFDVDGTLAETNAVSSYLYFLRRLRRVDRWRRLSAVAARLPRWWWLERVDRARFDVEFYSLYHGVKVSQARAVFRHGFEEFFAPRLVGESVARARGHLESGHRLVLISGAPSFIVEPFAARLGASDWIASRIEEERERLTGRLLGPPVSGAFKAAAAARWASTNGIQLAQCFAYGDSIWDAPLLESVGHPVAVRPDRRLLSLAIRRGWEVLEA
jgi:HAD superfamily hydrolase (TIGR01490 family)